MAKLPILRANELIRALEGEAFKSSDKEVVTCG